MCVGIVGVVIGVSMNVLLTPKIASIGSALAWGCSELGVLCSGVYLVKRIMNLSFNMRMILRKLLESIVFFVPFIMLLFPINHWIEFVISAIYICVAFVWLNLYKDKNKYVVEIWNKFLGRFYTIN